MKRKAGGKAKSARAKRPPPARAAAKTRPKNSIDALVAASAQALGLKLDPAWEANVTFNLQLILRHAALVDEFALSDDSEPAPTFHA